MIAPAPYFVAARPYNAHTHVMLSHTCSTYTPAQNAVLDSSVTVMEDYKAASASTGDKMNGLQHKCGR